MDVRLSPEGMAVFGNLCVQAREFPAARRVALEVAEALCAITGIAMPALVSVPSVVVDAVGDLDWSATAAAAGWLSPAAAADLQAAAEGAAAEVSGLVDDLAQVRLELRAREADLVTARSRVESLSERCLQLQAVADAAPAPAPVAKVPPAPAAPFPAAASVGDRPAHISADRWASMSALTQAAVLKAAAARGGK